MLTRLYQFITGKKVSVLTQQTPVPLIPSPVETSATQTALIQKTLTSKEITKYKDPDELGSLVSQLEGMVLRFAEERSKWEEHKKSLPLLNKIVPVSLRRDVSIKLLLNELLLKLKSLVQTADHNLDDLMAHVRPKIEALFADLHSIYEKISAENLSQKDRIELQHHLCDDCISVLNEIVCFINEVNAEINLCLKLEAIGEEIALNLAKFTILLLTDLPMPKLDLNLAHLYRKFLFYEIQPESHQINSLLLNTQAEMDNAEKVFVRSNSFFIEQPEMSMTTIASDATPNTPSLKPG